MKMLVLKALHKGIIYCFVPYVTAIKFATINTSCDSDTFLYEKRIYVD